MLVDPCVADARCPAGLEAPLRQRRALFEAIAADLLGPQRTLRPDLLPPALLEHHPATPDLDRARALPCRLPAYRVDLTDAPDGVWRVRSEWLGPSVAHPLAALFRAPALMPYLPALSRFLLGSSLQLASFPTLWLIEASAQRMVAANIRRWLLCDAYDPAAPPVALPQASCAARIALQDGLREQPWRFAARLACPAPSG